MWDGPRPLWAGSVHRTGSPVPRDRFEARTFEGVFSATPAKGEPDRLIRVARAALDTKRRPKRAMQLEGGTLSPAERFHVAGRELYIDFRSQQGMRKSTLVTAMRKAKFPAIATARNWNTVTKLAAMTAPATR